MQKRLRVADDPRGSSCGVGGVEIGDAGMKAAVSERQSLVQRIGNRGNGYYDIS
ncbi:MAG: hypothetical protein ABIS03_11505 [Gemmatimonadaceae bacterium]